jgi:hypothetical protein
MNVFLRWLFGEKNERGVGIIEEWSRSEFRKNCLHVHFTVVSIADFKDSRVRTGTKDMRRVAFVFWIGTLCACVFQ